MNRNIMDDRVDRELRRRALATRLIAYQARTHTIEELTGFTRHQLATLRRRVGVSQDSRLRGPAPSSFEPFFRSPRSRSEGAVIGLLYYAFNATKIGKHKETTDNALERGERLCNAFALWRQFFPISPVEFEHLRLLGDGIIQNSEISFGYCSNCCALILVDLLAPQRRVCAYCARPPKGETYASIEMESLREDEGINLALHALQLLGGQLIKERQGAYSLEAPSDIR